MSRSKSGTGRRHSGVRQARTSPSRSSPGAASRRSLALLAILPIALAGIAYWNALDNPFVYDDHLTITGNPSLIDPIRLRSVLLHFRFRPLVNASYAVDRVLWGPEPLGFHVTNLLLHLLNVCLVWQLASRIFRDREAMVASSEAASGRRAAIFALVVSSLFAVHPLLSQAVGYVSARSELLSAAFGLASLLVFRRWIEAGGAARIGATLAFFACGLASKETAAALPFLALAWDRLLRLGTDEERRRRLLRLHLPLVAVIAAAGAVRVASFYGTEAAALPRSIGTNLLSQVTILWRYVGLLFAPHPLSVVHPPQAVSSPAEPVFLISAAGLAAAAWAAWWLRRRAPIVVLGAIWLLLVLAPSSSFIPLNELMAEHRVYLAGVGFFLAVGAAAMWLHDRLPTPPARRLQAAALAVVVLVLTTLTVRRGEVWSDEVRLFTEATERAPLIWASHFFLGEALRRRDGCMAAIDSYRRSIPLFPGDETAYVRIGFCLAESGHPTEARRELEAALALNPSSSHALDYLGRIAGNQGDFMRARDYFERAVAANPNDVAALIDLATLHERVLDQPEEALRLCREALSRGEVRGTSEDCVHRNEALIAARRRKAE